MVSETPEELLERIYISETFVPDRRLTSWLEGKKTETVSEKVFRGLSMTQTPQGILALVRMPRRDVKSLLKKSAFLILESIQDPGNLGTMVRTAEGAGVDAIFMSKTCVDIYNPKVCSLNDGITVPGAFCVCGRSSRSFRRDEKE